MKMFGRDAEMLKIGAIVQVRMSSQRLPGKVLQEVQGKPILQYIIERLKHSCTIKEFVIATSSEGSDDQVRDFCSKYQIQCYRGSLNDVASRFKGISEEKQWDAFVRINGDSPLIDQDLIDVGVNYYLNGTFDLVTNVFPRSYPQGQSVEIIRAGTFNTIYPRMNSHDDLEHVTRFFYQNKTEFAIYNFISLIDYSSIHLSVDTIQDMQAFSDIVNRMRRPHWDYHLEEILVLYKEFFRKLNGESGV